MNLDNKTIENLRRNYASRSFDINDAEDDPFKQFGEWFAEAMASDVPEPNAMTLATATPDGKPSARIVLLKSFSQDGFVFYTNYESRKGKELAENPNAALCFVWLELHRQIRIEGTISRTSRETALRYFQSRPKGSQIGAWVSAQSSVIKDRAVLENSVAELEQKYADAEQLPIPENWGGYCLKPSRIEFWQGRPSRLHDRVQYALNENVWEKVRLAP